MSKTPAFNVFFNDYFKKSNKKRGYKFYAPLGEQCEENKCYIFGGKPSSIRSFWTVFFIGGILSGNLFAIERHIFL